MSSSLLRLLQYFLAFVLGQTSANSACLLWSEVEGNILLALVEEAELRSLIGINYCEDLCDRFPQIVAGRGLSISFDFNSRLGSGA